MAWLIVDDVPGREIGYRAIVEQDGTTICNPSPMGEGAARLIAAAPDMHALLRVAVARLGLEESPPLLGAWLGEAQLILNRIEGAK
jgi:hypothetical protein